MTSRVENASESSILGSIVNRIHNVASALYNLARRVAMAVWNIFTCRCSNAVTPPIATQVPIRPATSEDQRNLSPSDQARMVLEASQTVRDQARGAVVEGQTVSDQLRGSLVAGETVIARARTASAQATAVLGTYQASLAQERMVLAHQAPLEHASNTTSSTETSSEVSLESAPVETNKSVGRGTTLGVSSTITPLRPSRAHIPVKDMTTIGEAEGDQDSSGSSTSVSSNTTSSRPLNNLHNGSSRAQRKKNKKGKGTQAPVTQKSSQPVNRTAGDSSGSKSKLPTGVQRGDVGNAVRNSGIDPSQLRGTLKSRGGHGKPPIPVTNSFQALADQVEGFELDDKRKTLVLVPTSDTPVSGSMALAGQSGTSPSDGKKQEK